MESGVEEIRRGGHRGVQIEAVSLSYRDVAGEYLAVVITDQARRDERGEDTLEVNNVPGVVDAELACRGVKGQFERGKAIVCGGVQREGDVDESDPSGFEKLDVLDGVCGGCARGVDGSDFHAVIGLRLLTGPFRIVFLFLRSISLIKAGEEYQ